MADFTRRGFTLALPSSGLTTFRPGDEIVDLAYSDADLSAISGFASANPTYFVVDGTPAIDAALPEVLALRLRAGDPVGYFQASQNLLDDAYITDHP